MKILSQAGGHYATLTECADGIAVAIWEAGNLRYMRDKRIFATTLPVPMHKACEAVHAMVWSMAPRPLGAGRD